MTTKNFINSFILLLILPHFFSCLTAGTHGSIKAYNFPVTKLILQRALEEVISESPDILKDTTKNYIVDITNGKSDTILNNYCNDGQHYVTIQIGNKKIDNKMIEYTLQYVGSKEDWDTSKTSSLSVAYAYDENGKGGSDQDGGFSFKPSFQKEMTNFFESKFIDRLQKKIRGNEIK